MRRYSRRSKAGFSLATFTVLAIAVGVFFYARGYFHLGIGFYYAYQDEHARAFVSLAEASKRGNDDASQLCILLTPKFPDVIDQPCRLQQVFYSRLSPGARAEAQAHMIHPDCVTHGQGRCLQQSRPTSKAEE